MMLETTLLVPVRAELGTVFSKSASRGSVRVVVLPAVPVKPG